jgi:hypothetical protein
MSDVIEAVHYRAHAYVARLVTARKYHRCAFSRDVSWGRACRDIRSGDQYIRITVFPGHDVIDTDRPVTDPCCLACAHGYDGISSLVPAEAAS